MLKFATKFSQIHVNDRLQMLGHKPMRIKTSFKVLIFGLGPFAAYAEAGDISACRQESAPANIQRCSHYFSQFYPPPINPYGNFNGSVVAKWLNDGRAMQLVEPFAYFDPDNLIWLAPSGSVVDGASIPEFAWSLIGGPFEGKYRNASVIHDVACVEKRRSWQSVHKAFYTAMLASGVDKTLAKIMFGAVYHFGPRWDKPPIILRNLPTRNIHAEASSKLSSMEKGDIGNYSIIETHITPCENCLHDLETADVIIKTTPQPKYLSLQQFEALKKEIQSKDLSIGDIEDFNPHEH